jgi:hypothetical protein
MMENIDSILSDVTNIVKDVKPWMFEDQPSLPSNDAATSAGASKEAEALTAFGLQASTSPADEEEEDVGKTDSELDKYIAAYVDEVAAAVKATDAEEKVCPPCPC